MKPKPKLTLQQFGLILIINLPMLAFIGSQNAGMKSDALAQKAKTQFAAGHYTDAEKSAKSALAFASFTIMPMGDGNAVHDGHVVLGQLALRSGNIASAKAHLLAAGMTSGSPNLDSFGPNMTLAKELLAHGERETVLRYFAECRHFWSDKDNYGQLNHWSQQVRAGQTPDFGPNLVY